MGERRQYGLQVGDKVQVSVNNNTVKGEVVELDSFDNNRVYIEKPNGEITDVICEHCDVIERNGSPVLCFDRRDVQLHDYKVIQSANEKMKVVFIPNQEVIHDEHFISPEKVNLVVRRDMMERNLYSWAYQSLGFDTNWKKDKD
jgi:hypothetical protein